MDSRRLIVDPAVSLLRGLLVQWATGYAESRGRPRTAISSFDDLHPDEAAGFLKAIDHGILNVDSLGRCTLPGLSRKHGRPTEPSTLFWRERVPIEIGWREYVMQVGVAAHLIVDLGWPEELVSIDPERDSAFDVGAYLPGIDGESMHVAAEVKTLRSQPSLEKMLEQMQAACEAGLEAEQLDLRKEGHKKYRGLLKYRPSYFLAVKPGVWSAFAVQWVTGTPKLLRLPLLPPFSNVAALAQVKD